MTRKESDALLDRLRKEGCIAKLKHPFGDNCIIKSADQYVKVYGDYVFSECYGRSACENTYEDFYRMVKNDELIAVEVNYRM